MCGIVGFMSRRSAGDRQELIEKMLLSLKHRGPNDCGKYLNNGVFLGHTRLSIHDLSSQGHQPMLSQSEQWVLVFNGEIYNYLILKKQLSELHQVKFQGESDTEVLVNAIEIWGVEKTLKMCVGMFALAAYHVPSQQLYLARDRFGEKPLYYGKQNDCFAFSSELKALKPLYNFGWEFNTDRDVLATYMRFSYVPTPYSIYENIFKLEPGKYLRVSMSGEISEHVYWDCDEFVFSHKKFTGTYHDAVSQLEIMLRNTVKIQMASDVPLGAFLSGGVDSSTIVALMQSQSRDKINTFSIGFNEKAFDEARYAKEVAKYIGSDHTELYVSEKDALGVIPKLSGMYDEPFADSSQIPTYLVSQLARRKVTVALSGDAGDEIFGGYNRYIFAENIKKKILDKRILCALVGNFPARVFSSLSSYSIKCEKLYNKFIKLQSILKHAKNSNFNFYLRLCSNIFEPTFVIGGEEINIYSQRKITKNDDLSYQEWMMYADTRTYLLDDILTKVDRAAMTVSLETRVPFLDHRVFEFAWSLPLEYKISGHNSKKILRDVLYKYVPRKLIDRPKMGFGIPLNTWLVGELREWVEYLISPEKLMSQGYLNPLIVRKYWDEHLSGQTNWQGALWNILMFQAWLEG